MAEETNKKERKGISLRKLNYVMSAITVIASVLLLISLYITARGYADARDNTEIFIICDRSANDLQFGSDYLTEQVRAFAVTGHIEYMNNYFNEVNVTKRRDNAINTIKETLGETDAYYYLDNAMKTSVELMDREYYSMRLAVEAYDIDLSLCPDEIKNVILNEADLNLPEAQQAEMARNIVFDSIYKEYKRIISESTQASIGHLTESTEKKMAQSLDRLNVLLVIQRITVAVLVVVIGGVIAVTSSQVIKPLLRAVPRIKEEKPLSLKGAFEYKFLAKTYNKMYETNRRQKRKLKYDATHDILTNTLNRAGYESLCDTEELADYAVLVIDIDDFKHVNDTQGHDTGDRILKKTADEFKKSFRVSDYICRVGGDEFIIIMNGIAAEEGRDNTIREKLSRVNENLGKCGDGLPVISVSAGVAYGKNEDELTKTVKIADDKLYEVKKNGKHGISFQ